MKDRLVIVVDSRGHGRSTRTAVSFGYDLMPSDDLALLDYLKIDKVDLVGWADGGIIGLDIAMSRKRRLRPIGFSFAFSGFGSWTEADELVGESRMSSL